MAKRGRKLKSSDVLYKSSRKNTPSYISLLYGAISVIILLVILFLGLNALKKTGTIGENGISTTAVPAPNKSYIVQEGDSLWTISQKIYNDGYQWTKLAEANRIENPNTLPQGMEIVIPNIPLTITPRPTITQETASEPEITPTSVPVAVEKKIQGSSYTVVEGDNLWTIAKRTYGDPYRWVDIARANNLANPDLIYPGNKFILPR